MLHRQLDRIHAFFQRPGVTPGRVAPWLALGVLAFALAIGLNLEPLDQERAAYDDGSIVVAGGGPAAPAPAPAASGTGAVAGASDSGGEDGDDASDDAGAGEDSSAASEAPVDDSVAGTFPEPVAEPPYVEPVPDPVAEDEAAADDQPSNEPTEPYEGTVVAVNERAESYSIATPEQDLISVHAEKLPKPGDSIRVDVRPLANGTYAEATEHESLDQTDSAQFRGWVTWAAEDGLTYTVSNRGASILISRPAAGDALPLGAAVIVAVELDRKGGVTESSFKVESERTDAPVHVAAIVGEVDTAARRVTLSADQTRASKTDITVAVPDAAIDLAELERGDAIDATIAIGADGGYTLTGFSANEDAKAADDPKRAQGDQVEQEDPAVTGKMADLLLKRLGIEPAR